MNTTQSPYSLAEVIDIDRVRELLRTVHGSTGDTLAVMDRDNNIPIAIGFQDVCVNFHRKNPITEAKCVQASAKIHEKLFDGPYAMYECPNGIVDIAFPIVISDQYVGTFWTGQVFIREPDWGFFERQGRELGFDQTAYVEALRRVPVRSQSELSRSIAFYQNLVGFIGEVGFHRLQQATAEARLRQEIEVIQKQEDLIRRQTSAILEMSTPVIEVWGEILVMPLIGTVDTQRAQQIIENLLEAIVKKSASVVIMDITGVPVVDTKVANHFIKTIDAARMLGAEVILTGVSPHNAQTLVKLGVDLTRMATKSSLQAGLKLAFEMTQNRVVKETSTTLHRARSLSHD